VVVADRCKERPSAGKAGRSTAGTPARPHSLSGNIQALFTAGGIPLWVSPVLPGRVHDLTAAREHVLALVRPYLKDLPVLAVPDAKVPGSASTSR